MPAASIALVDANSPFFTDISDPVVNWSKIPFHHLERDHQLKPALQTKITQQFRNYVARVAAVGYTAISLDDLVHLAQFEWHSPQTAQLVAEYRDWYRQLVKIAADQGLAVYLTADIGSSVVGRRASHAQLRQEFVASVQQVLKDFPHINGIIVRFGEHDGQDVTGTFKSQMVVKQPRHLRRIIHQLVPFMEQFDRQLIVRTWSVGAFSIGDLIWNRRRSRAVFRGVTSENVIVSAKPGPSDFFRYLEPNPVLSDVSLPVLLELQAKPEYEGAGWLPTVWASEYQRAISHFRERANLIGISVWAQTGGWTRSRSLTFGQNSSLWNELNTYLAIGIWNGHSLTQIYQRYISDADLPVSSNFLASMATGVEAVAKTGWYIRQFAQHRLFFRRTRIPPLLWIYWDEVTIEGPLGVLFRAVVKDDGFAACQDGYTAVMAARELRNRVAREWPQQLPVFNRWVDTVELLFLARLTVFSDVKIDAKALRAHIDGYHQQYPEGMHFHIAESLPWVIATGVNWLSRFWIRNRMQYRKRDRLQMLPGIAHALQAVVILQAQLGATASVQSRAMSLAMLFK